jgi:hypothetical protein
MTTMKLSDFLRPRKPAAKFAEKPESQYWVQDGVVHFRFNPIKGADAESFRCYLSGYAVDKKNCYSSGKRLKADRATFEVLNFTYSKDKNNVWAMGIRIPTADPKSFEVCDDGAFLLSDDDTLVWYGYGKDKNGVYYYDYDGKPTLLKKADPATFESLGDKLFGRDAQHVFINAAVLPKADPATWDVIAGGYSRDAKRVFFQKETLPAADPKRFKVLTKGDAKLRAGCDHAGCFYFDMPIKREEYDKLAAGKLDWTVLHGRRNARNAAKR